MREYTLSHVSDSVLRSNLIELVCDERGNTARILAHIAEFDERALYAREGYSSMFSYCVEKLHLSEDAAYKRITAARAALKFPVLFVAVADGRLHLTTITRLAAHLTSENVDEIVAEASHRKKSEIDALLARRFGVVAQVSARSRIVPIVTRRGNSGGDLIPERVVEAPPVAESDLQLVPEPVGGPAAADDGNSQLVKDPASSGNTDPQRAPGRVEQAEAQTERRLLVQFTISQEVHGLLQQAQELLSHAVPSGDLAQIFERSLRLLVAEHEKRKLGAVRRAQRQNNSPRSELRECEPPARRASQSNRNRAHVKRYVPAHVRRAVWERDQGQCTFTTATGKRCTSRRFLEFDHVDPVARGGTATVERIRLRCRAHNQYEAERLFGAGFMARKRQGARIARAARTREATTG